MKYHAVKCAIEKLSKAGPLAFGQVMPRPDLQHVRTIGSVDDAPRPRLPSILVPKPAEHKSWTYALLGSGRESKVRFERSMATALNVDTTKVSKCWAAPILHPNLETPASYPHRGPNAWDDAPLGNSRLFRWRPYFDEHIMREELTQMEAIAEAMEPGEFWVQKIGVLKKKVVNEALDVKQIDGHMVGCSRLSPFCNNHDIPVAAAWCTCAHPKQKIVSCLMRERWHIDPVYHATDPWRNMQIGRAHV